MFFRKLYQSKEVELLLEVFEGLEKMVIEDINMELMRKITNEEVREVAF